MESTIKVNFTPSGSRLYYEGVEGILSIAASESLSIGYISAQLLVTAQIQYQKSVYRGRDAPPQISYLTFQHEVQRSVVIVQDHRPCGLVLTESISVPVCVSFFNDKELPSSISVEQFNPFYVKCDLEFLVHSGNGAILAKTTLSPTMSSVHRYSHREKPLKVHRSIGILCTCSVAIFNVATDKTVYGPGDRIRISYWYDAASSRRVPRITSVQAKLKTHILGGVPSSDANAGVTSAVDASSSAFSSQFQVPQYGQVCQGILDLPDNVLSDYTSGPLTVRTKLTLRFGIGRLVPYILKLVLPIVINGTSNAQCNQIKFPVMSKHLSAATLAAQQCFETEPNPPQVAAAYEEPATSGNKESMEITGAGADGSQPKVSGSGYASVPSK